LKTSLINCAHDVVAQMNCGARLWLILNMKIQMSE